MRPIVVVLLVSCILHATVALAENGYDFRISDAYTKLSKEDCAKLEQVHRDFMMLWGALDRYADSHDGNPPEMLAQLVPDFLGDLPTDPFATAETARHKDTKPYEMSKDGWGYRYRRAHRVIVHGLLPVSAFPGFRIWPLRAMSASTSVKACGFPGSTLSLRKR